MTSSIDTSVLGERLRREIHGEALTDPLSLGIYATDASMYQIMPLAVVVPRDRADALRAVRIASELGAPILPRGGGTSLSGQTIARAVVIDCSKYLNHLLELNVAQRWARVEPGLALDELNAKLKPHGLHFAPDPATSNRAAIGGMIANNAAGMRSILYGMTIDHVLELDLALSTGDVLNLGMSSPERYEAKCRLKDREGEIYRGFLELIEDNRKEILARYPKVRRRSGGYALDAFTGPMPWNLARIVCGSEGTLGLVLEAKLNLEPLPAARGLCVAHFAAMGEALRAVEPVVERGPSCVELLDRVIVDLARENLLTRRLCGFIEGRPEALLIIEAGGESAQAVRRRLETIVADLRDRGLGYAFPLMYDASSQNDVWVMRKNGLGLMTTVKGDRKPIAFIEDAAVPLNVMPEYIEQVLEICRRQGEKVSIYAHASVGLIHVRPMLDLHQRAELDRMKRIAEEVFQLVVRYGGSWSGEHGDGIVRGGFNERFFGSRLYEAFRRLKGLFDPAGLMNPGKIIDTPPMDENQRTMPDYRNRFTETMFHYREEGGFRQAVEQCTGVGACRKTLEGTMCPSYIATRDEEHSTRGRANAMRLAMTGQLGEGVMAGDRLRAALDLCLACKGCKNECPNNVDMARLKAEVMHEYHRRHGSTLRERMIRDMPRMAALASGPAAPLINWAMRLAPVRWALDRAIGIDRRRMLPAYASQSMSHWFHLRDGGDISPAPGLRSPASSPMKVALFNDTYMQNHEPQVGRAAVEALEAAGFEITLISPGCCQRPAMSKGFLDVAKREGTRTFQNLDPIARQGIPILVCEPSCATALTDDLPDLIDDDALARRVSAMIKPMDQFLEEQLAAGRIALPWRMAEENPSNILLHGHCHQKALYGTAATLGLLRRIPGAQVREIQAGCCGMAGSFGYEKEHYELSMNIGEDRLFPALREAGEDVNIAACGFSCRRQIREAIGRNARHAIEIVRSALKIGE